MGSGPSKDEKKTNQKSDTVVKKQHQNNTQHQEKNTQHRQHNAGIVSKQSNELRSPAKKTLPPLGMENNLDRNSNMKSDVVKQNNKINRSIEDLQSDLDKALQDSPVKRPTRVSNHSRNSQNSNHVTDNRSESVLTKNAVSDEDLEDQILEEFEEKDYPETYAQKIARRQYVGLTKKNDHNLDRDVMKAGRIRKNSDEWKLEENIIDGFDPNRFKKANKLEMEHEHEEIYENNRNSRDSDYTNHLERSEDYSSMPNNTQTQRKNERVIQYDEDEDALIADIEREFHQ